MFYGSQEPREVLTFGYIGCAQWTEPIRRKVR